MSMYKKVEICGVNTSKLITISEAEKRELLKKSREGDKKAREKLINANLKLVLSVLQSFSARGGSPDDLFQVGCIGLIKAVDNFDLSQEVIFSTYAVPMIIGEVRRYLRDDNHIRVSRSVRDTAYKALQVKDRLSKSLSREPTPEEISKELGISQREVTAAMDAIMEPISLYEPIFSENGDSLYVMDQISDKNNNDENLISNIAITVRVFRGIIQKEVSDESGISHAQVSRLEKTALEKIRGEL